MCCWFGDRKELGIENSELPTQRKEEEWGESIAFCTGERLGPSWRERASCILFVLEPTMSALVGGIAGFRGIFHLPHSSVREGFELHADLNRMLAESDDLTLQFPSDGTKQKESRKTASRIDICQERMRWARIGM